MTAALHHWSDEYKLEAARTNLKGPARELYEGRIEERRRTYFESRVLLEEPLYRKPHRPNGGKQDCSHARREGICPRILQHTHHHQDNNDIFVTPPIVKYTKHLFNHLFKYLFRDDSFENKLKTRLTRV